jgi:hypothetical protein
MRKGMFNFLLLSAVLVALLLIPNKPIYTLPGCGGHLQSDPTKVCYSADAIPPTDILRGLPEILSATDGYICDTPANWKTDNPGQIPERVAMRMLDGKIIGVGFDRAWSLAEQGQAYTVSFCN